jgi:glucosylceramidase
MKNLLATVFMLSTLLSTAQKVTIYTTAENTANRLTQTETLTLAPFGQPFENQPCVFVDPSETFQTFLGIGGALTDASAETFAKLPADKQKEVLTAYFDKEKGIGYTLARTNINSCDFSSDMYTYIAEGDKDLKTFNLAHDEQYKIPFIKKAMDVAGHLDFYVSPWSPPAWMKDNNDMLQGGHLKPEFYDAWANYFVRFIQEYEKRGIPVWGLSVQNEPMAKQTWESCIYTAEEERDFIKKSLGPTLQRNGLGSKKLIAWDHNRDLIYQRASTYLHDPEAAKYIWGIGFHWYEDWNGGLQFPVLLGDHQPMEMGRTLRPEHDSGLQQRRRGLDGLEHPARRNGRPKPCEELLLCTHPRQDEGGVTALHELVLLHRSFLEIHTAGGEAHR